MIIKVSSLLEVKKHLEGIKAVIFDMDDTLYEEKEYVKSGYKEVVKLLPGVENAEEKLYGFFESGKSAIDELLISENIYSEELKGKCLLAYRYHTPDIHLYDGVADLLSFLRENGYKLGIITDGRSEGQRAKISALHLEEYVDHIIVTDELGGAEFRKPNKTAYELMKTRFQVEYSQMMYVGDNINKDFIFPEISGMKAVYFNNPSGIYYV